MIRFAFPLLGIALLCAAPITMGGCSPTDGPIADPLGLTPSEGEDGGLPQGGGASECGSRTVGSVPGAAFIEMDFSWEVDIRPADSPLGKVLLGGIACWTSLGSEGARLLYESDAQGTIVALHTLFDFNGRKYYTSLPISNERLVIEGGCLILEHDTPDPQEPEQFDPSQFPEGPCGLGQVPVGHDGQVGREPEGEYTCVEYASYSVCQDCWTEDGVWQAESTSSATLVARGSIDNVSVSAWATLCDEPDQAVNIRDGDSVDYSLTGRTTYRVSPSPEELGYQRL